MSSFCDENRKSELGEFDSLHFLNCSFPFLKNSGAEFLEILNLDMKNSRNSRYSIILRNSKSLRHF